MPSTANREVFAGIRRGEYVYFVHSYYAEQGPYTAATCNYIEPFSAAMQKDNFVATQFHPEKSGPVGARILEQFVKDKPC